MSGWGVPLWGQGGWGGTTPTGTIPVTDQQTMIDMQYHLLENGDHNADGINNVTTMFTIQEFVDVLNQRQERFLMDTGMISTRVIQAITVAQGQYALPADDIMTRRIAFTNSSSVTKALTRSDTWELDHGMADWPISQGEPIAWWDTTLPSLEVGIVPAPNNNGSLELLYIALSTTLTGLGVNFNIAADWVPYIMWGAIADLLGSDGESFDPVRAQYCEQRYDEGVEMARIVLRGFGG